MLVCIHTWDTRAHSARFLFYPSVHNCTTTNIKNYGVLFVHAALSYRRRHETANFHLHLNRDYRQNTSGGSFSIREEAFQNERKEKNQHTTAKQKQEPSPQSLSPHCTVVITHPSPPVPSPLPQCLFPFSQSTQHKHTEAV